MKKFILAALIAVTITTTAFADANTNISTKVTDNFSLQFEAATNVQWTLSSTYIKASFMQFGEKLEAFYLPDGSLIGTSKQIALDKLPENAVRNITKKYPFPPYKLKECIQFENADGVVSYYVSLEEEGKSKTILEISAAGGVSTFQRSTTK